MRAKYSANQIYAVMKPYTLTPAQTKAVQEAPIDSASLVVAGAGSGKTELMAVRVLWLVANGFARPEQILGLTFTRKAANELAKRIYENLLKLRDSEYWPADLEYDFTQPTVSTYNSYANNLFRDNAVALGYESDSLLLTDAAAYRLCEELLLKDGSKIDERLADLDLGMNSIIGAVLDLAASMNDNLVHADQVVDLVQEIVRSADSLPQKAGGTDFAKYAYVNELLSPLANTPTFARLAQHYREEKHRRGFVDYSDQVVLAERAATQIPGVVEREQLRFSQVLLDEYQDTSYLQTRLLKTLFFGHSVFAVGDPNQSIYGWRGASASNLTSFGADFTASGQASLFDLPTSWRNPRHVLNLANHLSQDLADPASYERAQTQLKPLKLLPADKAPNGDITVDFTQDMAEEATAIAQWFKSKMNSAASAGENPTAAVLLRKRSKMSLFVDALESEGLSVQVVGLGGLLELPEIVDLVSALKVISNPASGTELVRLLTGARWRIGAKDIDRLFKLARELNSELRFTEEFAPEDALSLVDALDRLLDEDVASRSKISEVGLIRMLDAARVFAHLRTQTGLPLVEFVRAVEQELWLDIEVMANPRRRHPMSHLNAFAQIVTGYATTNDRPSLGYFLKWLDTAEERERFEVPTPTPESGVVQVMTVHAAKGLEWDFVAVANLIEGDFPSKPKSGNSGWLSAGKLPWQLRGDRDSLPNWDWQSAQSQKELRDNQLLFKQQVAEHQLREELRLMYVAVTRPRHSLLLTGSYFKPANQAPRNPSAFLLKAIELDESVVQVKNRQSGSGSALPECKSETNPLLEHETQVQWPLDPLGESHRRDLLRAAQQTLGAISDPKNASKIHEKLQRDLDLLIAERDSRTAESWQVELPIRVSASRFKDYTFKTVEMVKNQLRPMPEKPYVETRAGTIFHNLMEAKFARSAHLGDADFDRSDVYIADLAEYRELVEELEAKFKSSRFANLIPVASEIEIQVAHENNIYVCKIDAVFETEDGFEIVDWKTGKAPTSEAEIEERSLQLALYRMAWSRFKNVPPEKIKATLYYVQDQKEIVAAELASEAQLFKMFNRVPELSLG